MRVEDADKTFLALPFLTGNHFSNTKDTTVTKEKHKESRLFSPFVYFVSFVVRLFLVDYGTPVFFLDTDNADFTEKTI